MKTFLIPTAFALLILSSGAARGQDIIVSPARGGGLDTNAPMIHTDIFYDYTANRMQAVLVPGPAIPALLPLPVGYTFDARSNYYVFNGKAYNFQYAWNPGGLFTNPPGAAVWIECINASPGLDCYDGPGNKSISPPRAYAPIFGTTGSSTRWKWYGKMAHNTYAVLNPTSTVYTATYRVYFGDADTGAPEAFTQYDDAVVTWTWRVDLPVQPRFEFGAVGDAGSALSFLNADEYLTNSLAVLNLRYTNAGPCAIYYACAPVLSAAPATASNGGPATNHAAPGSCLQMQLVALAGPPQSALSIWEPGNMLPVLTISAGENAGTNRVLLSQNEGWPGTDPYGCIEGRHLAVNRPGLYCLGFRAVDSSTNGPNGGPVHPPSPVCYVYLQAGLTANQLTRLATATKIYFGGEPMKTFYLERSAALTPSPAWETVAGPLTGTAKIQNLTDRSAAAGVGFYRLRATNP